MRGPVQREGPGELRGKRLQKGQQIHSLRVGGGGQGSEPEDKNGKHGIGRELFPEGVSLTDRQHLFSVPAWDAFHAGDGYEIRTRSP